MEVSSLIFPQLGRNELQSNLCEKIFVSTSTLKNHMILHTYDKLHLCQASILKKHIRILTGETTSMQGMQCLKTHILIHTGEKPYQCDQTFPQATGKQTNVIPDQTHSSRRYVGYDI